MQLSFGAGAIAIAIGMTFAHYAAGQPAPLRVFASNGVKAVVEELQPKCEQAIGHPLAIEFNSAAVLKQRIEGGEAFDVALLTNEALDALIKEGKVAAGSRADLARAGVGVGIRAGAPKPDIKTPEAMKQTLLKAKSVTYAKEGASRTIIEKMYDRFGIAGDMKPKVILQTVSGRAQTDVAEGKAEMVITLIPEILPVHGIQMAGPLPGEVQGYISFRAGVSANSNNAEAGKALIKFLTGPAAAPVYKAKGMEQVH
jgi:molybdate transport system substrate-binding protein